MTITYENGIVVGPGIDTGYILTDFITEDSINIFVAENGDTFIEE